MRAVLASLLLVGILTVPVPAVEPVGEPGPPPREEAQPAPPDEHASFVQTLLDALERLRLHPADDDALEGPRSSFAHPRGGN